MFPECPDFGECQPGELSGKIGNLAGTASTLARSTRVHGPRFRGPAHDAGVGPTRARTGFRPSWDTSRSCCIAGLILINGFFVTAEFALVKVRATQIDQLAEQGNWAARLTSKALDRLDFYLSASQIGITMASLALGSAMHEWVEPGGEGGVAKPAHPHDPDRGLRRVDRSRADRRALAW